MTVKSDQSNEPLDQRTTVRSDLLYEQRIRILDRSTWCFRSLVLVSMAVYERGWIEEASEGFDREERDNSEKEDYFRMQMQPRLRQRTRAVVHDSASQNAYAVIACVPNTVLAQCSTDGNTLSGIHSNLTVPDSFLKLQRRPLFATTCGSSSSSSSPRYRVLL